MQYLITAYEGRCPMSVMPVVVVNSHGASRIRAGHPWVFRQDVVRGPDGDAASGGPSLVDVHDGRGKPLGTATWAAHARLALRMLARDDDALPDGDGLLALVARRLDAALARRTELGIDRRRDAFRVVHGESDQLPRSEEHTSELQSRE